MLSKSDGVCWGHVQSVPSVPSVNDAYAAKASCELSTACVTHTAEVCVMLQSLLHAMPTSLPGTSAATISDLAVNVSLNSSYPDTLSTCILLVKIRSTRRCEKTLLTLLCECAPTRLN